MKMSSSPKLGVFKGIFKPSQGGTTARCSTLPRPERVVPQPTYKTAALSGAKGLKLKPSKKLQARKLIVGV